MDKYLEADKRLVELLYPGHPVLSVIEEATHINGKPWRWTLSWNACGPLMVEHDVALDMDEDGEVHASCKGQPLFVLEEFTDHPDKDAAVRYAIVMAVIKKLEGE